MLATIRARLASFIAPEPTLTHSAYGAEVADLASIGRTLVDDARAELVNARAELVDARAELAEANEVVAAQANVDVARADDMAADMAQSKADRIVADDALAKAALGDLMADRLAQINESDPIGGAHILAEAFTAWFASLPSAARDVARWNVAYTDADTVRDFLADAIGLDLDPTY